MAGHGIGLAGIPEVDTGLAAQSVVAQNALVARAQGSLVPRQDQPAATTPVGLGQQAGQPATAQPATAQSADRKPGTIDFEKDPLGSIGLILREAGAALQDKPSPSAKVRKDAKADERLRAGLALQAQGLRLKAASQGMASLLKAVELGRTLPPNELEKFFAEFGEIFNIKPIGGSGGFDVAGLAKDILEGKRPGLEDQIKELQSDPITAAYVANLIGDTPSIDRMEKAIEGALKLKADLVGKVLEQGVLAPGKKAADEEAAKLEIKTAKAKRETPEEAATRAGKVKAATEAEKIDSTKEQIIKKLASGEDLTAGEQKALDALARTDPFAQILNQLRADRVKGIVARQKLSSSDKELLEQATKALADKGRAAVEKMLRQLGRDNLIALLP